MNPSYKALCSDVYVNLRVNLKMDLAMRRETILAFFDRVRREHSRMDRFRRYSNELALESAPSDEHHQWLAVRKTSIRAGVVNPESVENACKLHRLASEVAPYFLDISALDIDYVELLFGFDLPAACNHDEVVFNALIAGSPLADLADAQDASLVDCQPILGFSLTDSRDLQAHFEVKTRSAARDANAGEFREEPISLYLTMRRYGPIADVAELPGVLDTLRERGERLVESKLVPTMLVPLRDAIASGSI